MNQSNTAPDRHDRENLSRPALDRRFCVAPMLDWTDRHSRHFFRLISEHALLYTEMVTTGAIIHGETDRFLRFNASEHPVAVQLGGANPAELARCAKICEAYGYDEVNLNVGCPSDRVQSGAFGACLMATPALVAQCVDAMRQAITIPVTVKCRIGIDNQDDHNDLQHFVSTVAAAGCETFIIHARKAWLQGLSPRQNRDIPPLNYERVHQLKRDFPHLEILINGGLKSLVECRNQLPGVDGVMVGREAYQNPYLLADVDNLFYGTKKPKKSRSEILERLYPYIEQEINDGAQLKYISRHILGLFQGMPGARAWRRHISEQAFKPGAGVDVIKTAAGFVIAD